MALIRGSPAKQYELVVCSHPHVGLTVVPGKGWVQQSTRLWINDKVPRPDRMSAAIASARQGYWLNSVRYHMRAKSELHSMGASVLVEFNSTVVISVTTRSPPPPERAHSPTACLYSLLRDSEKGGRLYRALFTEYTLVCDVEHCQCSEYAERNRCKRRQRPRFQYNG